MTIIPRSRSSSEGRTHFASGTVGLPAVVVEAEEEEKAVLRWVRVVCATCGEISARGAKRYIRPALKRGQHQDRNHNGSHLHCSGKDTLLLVRRPLDSLHGPTLQIPPPHLSSIPQVPNPDNPVLTPTRDPFATRIHTDTPHA